MNKAAIEREARRVQVEIYSQRKRLFNTLPPIPALFDPRVVAEYYGLQYEFRDRMAAGQGMGFEAAGVLDRRRNVISVSTRFTYEVQRFTGAHELGHWVLHAWIGGDVVHRDRPLDGARTHGRPEFEQEADYFGACLLMPRYAVISEFERRFGTRRPLVLTETSAFHLGVRDPGTLFAAPRGSLNYASAVARAEKYDRNRFESMASFFGVSATAMAIRLEELDLVAAYLRA